MRIMLDTNILIWVMAGSDKLSAQAKKEIERASAIYVSAASIWEISIKSSLGKIQIDVKEMLELLDEMAIEELPITWEHAQLVKNLPFHHHDPFDRIMLAQAMVEPLVLLTSDKLLSQYSNLVKVV